MTRRLLCWLSLFGLLIFAPMAQAEGAAVPAELEPWVPWVLGQLPERDCRHLGGESLCAWPGRLKLDVADHGARFSFQVVLDADANMALPGSTEVWPQNVSVDGKDAVVLAGSAGPSAKLSRGAHEIKGEFSWPRLPDGLAIGAGTGVVELSVNGKRISTPKRDAGRVWFQQTEAENGETESVSIEVFRRIDDDVPLRITTRLMLHVSGRAREFALGKVLLAQTVPLSLQADLPVRLEPDQQMYVQLRPGSYRIEIVARSEQELAALEPLARGLPWPEHETWVFAANSSLREVEVEAPSTDPARTNLDQDWRSLPAYSLGASDSMTLKTTRRGLSVPAPNRMSLKRLIWLDLDGGGYTVRDVFGGSMQQKWRLDLESGTLGHATVDGRDELVSINPVTKRFGVELRNSTINLNTESRLPAGNVLRAVGWSEDAESLGATLYLPPGYRLLSVKGTDAVDGAWIDNWDLFDFFFVLVCTLALWRLAGVGWAAAMLGALVFCHGEDGAPRYAFVALLVIWALLALIPRGRFRFFLRGVWLVSLLTYAGFGLTFAVDQVRTALYPQLARQGTFEEVSNLDFAMKREAAVAAPAEMRADSLSDSADNKEGGTGSRAKSASDERHAPAQELLQDPKAVIQTGPGIPTWSWESYQLYWSGPVDHEHEIHLFLLPPALESLLHLIRVGLLAALGFVFFRRVPHGQEPPARAPRQGPLPAIAVATLALVLFYPTLARAEVPPDSTLEELKNRLNPSFACGDACVSVAKAELEVRGSDLSVKFEVHAGAPSVMPLAGPLQNFPIEDVKVDGRESSALALRPDGHLYLRLEPGVHHVEVSGPIPGDELTLAFGINPHLVRVSAAGWDFDGVREDGRVDGSIRLVRRLGGGDQAPAQSKISLPSWFQIERRFVLGVTWKIVSTLKRVSPPGTPAIVRLPLYEGEHVQGDLAIEGGYAVISLDRDATSKSFESTLDPRETLKLKAAEKASFSEVWVVDCGVMWHCEAKGVPPIELAKEQRLKPSYMPWPGEELALTLTRPKAAPGGSTTIDQVDYFLTPGVRLLSATLNVHVRSSTGGFETFTLPDGAKLKSVKVDNTERTARLDGRKLSLALATGAHVIDVEWQEPRGLEFRFEAPQVDLGRPAVNARVHIAVPSDRWLVLAGGPNWGPAILFWGYLLVVLGAAAGLGRIKSSPLSIGQWVLLGLGLTQVPSPVAIAIAAWFFLLSYRQRFSSARPIVHDLFQIFVAGSTLVFIGLLIGAVYRGLVVQPDMQVLGGGSYGSQLIWYLDHVSRALPQPWLVSTPLWLWQALMLAWALWLAVSLIRWLRWAFQNFTAGVTWLPLRGSPATVPPATVPPTPEATSAEPSPPATPGEPNGPGESGESS